MSRPDPPPDPRRRRSRRAMEHALLELAAERDLSRLSVSDVTRRARVHRTTFYEHYTDVHDVAASACTHLFDALVDAAPVLPLRGGDAGARGQAELTAVLTHIAEHADLYRALLGSGGSARVIDHLNRRLTVAVHVNRVGSSARTHAEDPEEIPHDPAAALLAGALMGVITDWLHRGCPGSPEDLGAAVAAHFVGTGDPGA